MSPTTITRDWAKFDPTEYLDEYYADLGSENVALLRFFVNVYRSVPEGGLLLDFGGGPTIYPLISAVTRVREIHFSDYLGANLDEVRRWLAADPRSFNWDSFIRKALELESGHPCPDAEVVARAGAIRQCVTRLMLCDASRTPPIEGARESYDVVVTNFCAESATSDRGQWQDYVANIVSVLRPGGRLIMSALKGATRYAVGTRFFPAVEIAERDLVDLLEEMEFPRAKIEVTSVPADRPTRDYQGLVLASAERAGG